PHVRFDEGMLETGYGQDNEALPKETGRNRKYKRCPEAIAPVFYSTMVSCPENAKINHRGTKAQRGK
ncbi:MAG: hypothetical protein ABH869_05600, partial [Candidatus Omnitrophota bacterium]